MEFDKNEPPVSLVKIKLFQGLALIIISYKQMSKAHFAILVVI